jgi:hypothetical protein
MACIAALGDSADQRALLDIVMCIDKQRRDKHLLA